MSKYNRLRKIDGKQHCEIYEVEYGPQKIKACAKVLKYTNESQLNKLINELNNLSSVKNLKMGLRYFDYILDKKVENNRVVNLFVIITEYCSKGNLNNLIYYKKHNNDPFQYLELVKIFQDLIEFFAILQEKGISHRDIKPDNFFIAENNDIKVGDFGSSKEIVEYDGNVNTITGTPNYLSPELRDGYQKFMQSLGGKHIEYSPYKSDVYSLGLVYLFMYTMEKLDIDHLDINLLVLTVKEKLKKIRYQNIKELLKLMLEFRQDLRPDFKQLFEKAKILFSKNMCFICKNSGEHVKSKCQECEVYYHHGCIAKGICLNCSAIINNVCSRCGNFEIWKCDVHKLCIKCGWKNSNCSKCIGFEILNCSVMEFHFFSCKFSCYACKNLLIPETITKRVNCNNCNENWCQICKRSYHGSSCSEVSDKVNLYCICGAYHSFAFDSIFYDCPQEGSLCLVCMKPSNKGHFRCTEMLNHSLGNN